MKNKESVTVGSLFAGIGGICKGFELAGAKLVWANEIDKFASKTYRQNFCHTLFEKSILDLKVSKDNLSSVDILTAGFPCQPFSVAGSKAGFNDQRGRLFFEIMRILREFKENKPKILFLENVRGLLFHDKGQTLRIIKKSLKKAGYLVNDDSIRVINTRLVTEIPQNRERVFILAFNRNFFDQIEFKFPTEVTENKSPFDYLDLNKKQKEFYYFDEKNRYYKYFDEAIKEQGDNYKKFYQLRRWYVRVNNTNTCPTLTANMGTGGHNVPVIKDQWGIRKLTEIECARLQGFDDNWFHFPEDLSSTQRYKQIGNSVTVPVIKLLAEECIRLLNKTDNSK